MVQQTFVLSFSSLVSVNAPDMAERCSMRHNAALHTVMGQELFNELLVYVDLPGNPSGCNLIAI